MALSSTVVAAFLSLATILGCGGDAIEFDDIDGQKKAADLSREEVEAVCAWSRDLEKTRLPESGTTVECHGKRIPFGSSTDCKTVPVESTCIVTVGQLRQCIPALVDELKRNPCPFLEVSSLDAFNGLVSMIPECAGVDLCAFTQ
jgi:hypothetical protein